MLLFCIIQTGASLMRADTGETVTIGDTVVGKFVTRLTFSGDDVVLNFDDGTSQTADMSLVSISLTYDNGTESSITDVTAPADVPTRIYSVSGQYVGNSTDGLSKGLYIVNGKKIIVK